MNSNKYATIPRSYPLWAADNRRKKDSCPPGAKEAYMREWRERMF